MKYKVLCLLILASFAVGCSQEKSKSKAYTYKCVAGPNEKCVSDTWYADWRELRDLQAKYEAPKDEADRMRGIAQRLSEQIPPGWQWYVPTERLIPIQAPPPGTPVQAPARPSDATPGK